MSAQAEKRCELKLQAEKRCGEEVRGRGAEKRCKLQAEKRCELNCSTALTVSRTTLTKSVPAREEYVSTHEAF